VSNLAELAAALNCSLIGSSDIEPTGVAISSANVEKGFIFVASPGKKHHGLDFLDQAIAAGGCYRNQWQDIGVSLPAKTAGRNGSADRSD